MKKNPLFSFALIFLALVVGYGIGKRGEPASDPLRPFEKVPVLSAEEETYKEKYLSLKTRFDQINKIDIEEYIQLRSQKEKYNKANEILGKMLVIFLAELGLKVSEQARDYAEGVTNEPGKYAYREPPRDSSPAKEIRKEEKSPSPSQVASWRENAKKIHSVTSLEEAQKFLDSVEIKNLLFELRVNQKMRRKTFNWLRGEFVGYILFDKDKNEKWDVEMSLHGELQENGVIHGQNAIKLSKNGEVFSNASGNGKIESYKALKGHPNAVIVEVGGRNGYFQIFRAGSLNRFIGNYYRESGVGIFHRVGKVYLERR